MELKKDRSESKTAMTENGVDNTAESTSGSSKKQKKKQRISKRFMLIVLLMLAVGCLGAGFKIYSMHPYAVSINGKDVCYVKDDEKAAEIMSTLAQGMIPEGAQLKAIKTQGNLAIDRSNKIMTSGSDFVEPEEAAQIISKAINDVKSNKGQIEITTVSTRVEQKSFTPKTKYERDDSMLAGESIVVQESKKGKREVLMSYTCVNGEVKDSSELKSKTLKKGRCAIIKKGTLGLPEGEDWKTYEGDPVFRDGEELVTTALNYLGAPYKYGGTSLETGIDCVAFVVQMFRKYGIYLPSSHKGLQNAGVGVSLANAKKGDIICYSKHVAIYLGDGKIVEATSVAGVRVGKLNTKRLVAIRRIVN